MLRAWIIRVEPDLVVAAGALAKIGSKSGLSVALKAMKEVAIISGIYPGKKQPLLNPGETGEDDPEAEAEENELHKQQLDNTGS